MSELLNTMKVRKIIFFCEYIIVHCTLYIVHCHNMSAPFPWASRFLLINTQISITTKKLSCNEIFVGRPKAGNQTSNIKSSKVLSNHLKVSQYCWGLSVKLRSVFSAGGGRAHGSHRSYYPASRAVVHFSAQDFVSFQFFMGK